MSLRFWLRVRLAPGVTLNLSKSTASLSFGPRGAKYTISPRGNRATMGLPGTGHKNAIMTSERAFEVVCSYRCRLETLHSLKIDHIAQSSPPANRLRNQDNSDIVPRSCT